MDFMHKNVLILLCSMLFGLGVTGCLFIPRAVHAGLLDDSTVLFSDSMEKEESEDRNEPVRTIAWWSVMYEAPNPERLPVQVRLQWLKGLE